MVKVFHLPGNLGEDSSCQRLPAPSPAPGQELRQLHKLDDVPLCLLTLVRQPLPVPVKDVHRAEVLVANSDNDHRHWQAGRIDEGFLGLVEVRDDAVGEDEEDKVIGSITLVGGSKSCHVVDHWREVSRPIQLDSVEGVVVGSYDSFNASTKGQIWIKS